MGAEGLDPRPSPCRGGTKALVNGLKGRSGLPLSSCQYLGVPLRVTRNARTDLDQELDLAPEATYPDNLPPFDDMIRRSDSWLMDLT